jgi:hypothetical protein
MYRAFAVSILLSAIPVQGGSQEGINPGSVAAADLVVVGLSIAISGSLGWTVGMSADTSKWNGS